MVSYLLPITIIKENSDKHDSIKVLRYQGQWLLESKSALYSEGTSYKPFKLAFASIKKDIPTKKNFLLLGAGLSSAVKILQEKYSCFPNCDIVDYDEKIIELNHRLPSLQSFNNIKFHCRNADNYLAANNKKYDLIGVDLFQEMEIAPIILSNVFLKEIEKSITPDAHIVINTIFQNEQDAQSYEKQLNHYFPVNRIDYKPNYIFICSATT